MKRKQLMALLMAGVVLAGSTMGSSASSVSSNTVSENSTGQLITGTGEVDYIDTTVYEVIIPTTSSLSLTVDPQGLTGLEDGKSATAEQLSAYAGKVYSDDVAVIANLGSKDVKVSVDLELTGDATGVTTKDAVESGTANNILLYAVPAAKDFYDDEKDGASYAGSTTGIVMGSTTATIDFVVPHTDFEFKKSGSTVTYERKADSTPHGTGLKFAGLVNTDADWTDYKDGGGKSIGMTAKFTFTHTLTSGDVADTTEGAPAFMKAYTGTKVTVEAEAEANGGTGATTPTDSYVMTADSNGSVSYTFVNAPTGSLTACTIDGTNRTNPIANGYISYSNGVLTIVSSKVSAFMPTSGRHSIVVTIGGQNYNLTYTN